MPLLTPEEAEQFLVEWNDTKADFPEGSRIHELFEKQVNQQPDALAIVDGERGLTYGELNSRANMASRHLQKLGVEAGGFVGFCVQRSVDMVVGLWAILKAEGGACAPRRRLP